MPIVTYPSLARFPAAGNHNQNYKAADTGAVYFWSAAINGYKPFWPDSFAPSNYQSGIIGSNRTLADTVHVRI